MNLRDYVPELVNYGAAHAQTDHQAHTGTGLHWCLDVAVFSGVADVRFAGGGNTCPILAGDTPRFRQL